MLARNEEYCSARVREVVEPARRENIQAGRAALKRQLERLTEAYLAEIIPLGEYKRRRHDLEQREEALASQERELHTQADQRM